MSFTPAGTPLKAVGLGVPPYWDLLFWMFLGSQGYGRETLTGKNVVPLEHRHR